LTIVRQPTAIENLPDPSHDPVAADNVGAAYMQRLVKRWEAPKNRKLIDLRLPTNLAVAVRSIHAHSTQIQDGRPTIHDAQWFIGVLTWLSPQQMLS
jgi:hypothetical protein